MLTSSTIDYSFQGESEKQILPYFEGVPIVSLNALAEAFPNNFKASDSPCDEPGNRQEGLKIVKVLSLATLSLNQAVQHALEDDRLELLDGGRDRLGKSC